MAKAAGLLFVLSKNATVIGGGRTLSMTANGAPIDVTDKDSAGIKEYLADVLTGRSLEFSVEGVEEDAVLRTIALSTTASGWFMSDLTFDFAGAASVTGNFVMTGYSETGVYEEAITYTATFTTDGAWTT
jgi:predicted secreted protein